MNGEDRVKIGENVKRLRKSLLLSQEELGMRSQVSCKFIGEIERGRGNPSIDSLAKIADGLGVRIMDILDFENSDGNGRTGADHASIERAVIKRIGAILPKDPAGRIKILQALKLMKSAMKKTLAEVLVVALLEHDLILNFLSDSLSF